MNTPGNKYFSAVFKSLSVGTAVLAFGFQAAAARAVSIDTLLDFAHSLGFPAYRSFNSIMETILLALLSIGTVVTLIFIVLSGYRFMASSGNEDKVWKARRNLFWAIIGFAVMAVAWFVVALIISTVHSDSLML